MPHQRLTELQALLSRNCVMAVRGFQVQSAGEAIHIVRAETFVGSWRHEGEKLVFLTMCEPGKRRVAGTVDEAVHVTMNALNEYCG